MSQTDCKFCVVFQPLITGEVLKFVFGALLYHVCMKYNPLNFFREGFTQLQCYLGETAEDKNMGYQFFFLLLKMGQSGGNSKAKFLSSPPLPTLTVTCTQTNTFTMMVLLLRVAHK